MINIKHISYNGAVKYDMFMFSGLNYLKVIVKLYYILFTDSVDCGVKLFGCCKGPSCLKLARLRIFVVVLTCAGLIQGACVTYFRISAKEAALEYEFNPIVVGK